MWNVGLELTAARLAPCSASADTPLLFVERLTRTDPALLLSVADELVEPHRPVVQELDHAPSAVLGLLLGENFWHAACAEWVDGCDGVGWGQSRARHLSLEEVLKRVRFENPRLELFCPGRIVPGTILPVTRSNSGAIVTGQNSSRGDCDWSK